MPGNIAYLVVGLLLIGLLFSCFGVVRVSGDSMDPTLADGQFLVGLHLNNLLPLTLSRGDIITATHANDDTLVIKRIIALPGDRVAMSEGQLYINGKLQYEPYIYEPMTDTPYSTIVEFTVPEGQYFILGDNRNISSDSRDYGCITTQQLQTLILHRHQAILTAAMIFCVLAAAWIADAASKAVDLGWQKLKKTKEKTPEDTSEAEKEL